MKGRRITSISKSDRKTLVQIKKILETSAGETHTLGSLAKISGISRAKLTRLFKELFDCSIHQYLVRIRMSNAKRMLKMSEKPIKEIAQLNGYSTTQNFITAFKKFTGKTPLQFQKGGKSVR